MGLLKSTEVEFIPISTQQENIEDVELEEELIIGEPIIIGGEFIEGILNENENETIEEGIVIGEPIIIGGIGGTVKEKEEVIEQEYIEENIQQIEEHDSSLIDEEYTPSIPLEILNEFSQTLKSVEAPTENILEEVKEKKVFKSIDEKIQSLLSEYRENLMVAAEEKASIITEQEREKILSEAVKEMAESDDVDTFQRVIANIDAKIFEIASRYQEEAFNAIEAQREQMMQEVQDYIDTTIEMHREKIMQEAQEFIEKMAKEYKEKIENDHPLLSNATAIINKREEILDEAYNKSLQMIEEAQKEVERIKEEEFAIQERINQMLAEAEERAEQIKAEAQEEAERIISEANMESARIIEEAEKSHQEIVEAATHDGFNVGYQEGREEAIKENAQLLMEATNALNRLHATFPMAVKQNEDKLIKLALEIASAVIQDELQARPELCLRTLETAIKRVSDLEKVIIKVNPLDLDLVLPKQEYFRSLLPDVQEFVITGHYSIARGGCLIESNSGTIDAQIPTQLAVVEEVFNKIRSEYDDSDTLEDTEESNEG